MRRLFALKMDKAFSKMFSVVTDSVVSQMHQGNVCVMWKGATGAWQGGLYDMEAYGNEGPINSKEIVKFTNISHIIAGNVAYDADLDGRWMTAGQKLVDGKYVFNRKMFDVWVGKDTAGNMYLNIKG